MTLQKSVRLPEEKQGQNSTEIIKPDGNASKHVKANNRSERKSEHNTIIKTGTLTCAFVVSHIQFPFFEFCFVALVSHLQL